MRASLVCLTLALVSVHGFGPSVQQQPRGRQWISSSILAATSSDSSATSSSTTTTLSAQEETARRFRAEAERIRLEAEKLDIALTLDKIAAIETKLANRKWLEKHPDQASTLEEQLLVLQRKLKGEALVVKRETPSAETKPVLPEVEAHKSRQQRQPKKQPVSQQHPIAGFDEADLALYLPVAERIEATMSNNATAEEKLIAFREAPELQEAFSAKIQALLVEPMQNLQKLENLKSRYLYSTSLVEKNQLKREIDQLESQLETDGPFQYADSIFVDTPPMSEDELQQRMQAVSQLPPVLQSLYKRRNNVNDDEGTPDETLRTAILVEHYEMQLQLLEQARTLERSAQERAQIRQALESLPEVVREHIARRELSLEDASDLDKMIEVMQEGAEDPAWSTLQQVVMEVSSSDDLPEYSDLDFVDRSRYVEEFFPSVARMEGQHPTEQEITDFVSLLDRRTFQVTTKPERVMGGYYIRGDNLLSDDESGTKLVERIAKSLAASTALKDRLQFFYIPDPSPLPDEQVEMGYEDPNVLMVTTKNATVFYDYAQPLSKVAVSLLGVGAMGLFALGSSVFQPSAQSALDAGDVDALAQLIDNAVLVAASVVALQLVHEVAHQVVAWKDKFEIGLPTPVPSVQLGTYGSITPLKSPPPNMRSLFDFSIAGPLAGLVASVAMLVTGLDMTASADLQQIADLPALPLYLLRSSTLGGGLIELFLGKGALMQDLSADTVLPLHPFAVAGYVGIMVNSLALLPLGHTDGGRISLTMFGRRGAFVVKTFTAVLLCIAGLAGLDESNILLTYNLYTLIWQRELETPVRNEVEELDFGRGLFGIATALLVGLALIPMQ